MKFKYLMNVNDPGIAFLLIMQFIHQFGSEKEESIPNSLSLLEEIREIGFDKVLDTNDEFSKLILRLPIDEGNFVSPMTVRILKNQTLEYSLDSFPGYPVAILKDSKKGFLGRILKIATSEYKELRKISEEIFRRIDDEFPTLNPERSSKEILKRRIHCDSSQKEEIEIFYNFKAKQIQINSRDKNNSFNPTNIIEIFTELSRILQANTENQQKDCGICYSSYLDGQVAAFLCKVCGQIYHETCLREWYTSNPECKTVFDKIIGTCLFCDEVRH